ncbi:hypothetical protein EK21DRAFT_109568 [Setomelanomma holmii]|uniref:Uncharacterized protein n=1 Tax=Setomelanomma holmii TaxID=210430 RepID=A0A9P4HEK5_9PLEO|nr:hypothetical protein EK21DRAFT_109568 [Setomelanomma holmii]
MLDNYHQDWVGGGDNEDALEMAGDSDVASDHSDGSQYAVREAIGDVEPFVINDNGHDQVQFGDGDTDMDMDMDAEHERMVLDHPIPPQQVPAQSAIPPVAPVSPLLMLAEAAELVERPPEAHTRPIASASAVPPVQPAHPSAPSHHERITSWATATSAYT